MGRKTAKMYSNTFIYPSFPLKMKRKTNSRKRETKKYWKFIKRKLIYPDYRNNVVDDFYYKNRWFLKDFFIKYEKEEIKYNIRAKF